jgi:Ca2+-dependent lipid-binding protein
VHDNLKKFLIAKSKAVVRAYMISAYDLASKDIGSASDPYLILTLGTRVYNERENYQNNEPNPEFYKQYDFEAIFPGTGPLSVKVMDYDLIFGDDMIGETKIDLEDRFFNADWQAMKDKPIEYRQIYHPSSSLP